MPSVNVLNPSDLDRIHIQRMEHARYELIKELIDLDDRTVNALLSRFSICLLPGRRVAIDYPSDIRQVLTDELIAEKARIAKEEKARARFAKSDCCARESADINHAPGCKGKKAKAGAKRR